jgi:hypothetical protein
MPTSKVQDAAKCLKIVIEPEKYGFQDLTCSGSSRVVRGSRRIYLTYCALPGKPLEIHFPRYCGPFSHPKYMRILDLEKIHVKKNHKHNHHHHKHPHNHHHTTITNHHQHDYQHERNEEDAVSAA